MNDKEDKPNPEHVMDAFRLARSGNYKTVDALKKSFSELYPDVDEAATNRVFKRLAALVLKS